MSVVLK
jgi:isopenicillin N synthase-like dioxygenase